MIVVSDTGPIHYLVLCGAIDLLRQLYRAVVIPISVKSPAARRYRAGGIYARATSGDIANGEGSMKLKVSDNSGSAVSSGSAPITQTSAWRLILKT